MTQYAHVHEAAGTPVFIRRGWAPQPAWLSLASTSFLPALLGHSGSWWTSTNIRSEHTYQVTQGTGQLFSNFEFPWCGEDVAFPVHEEIQRPTLHKLFHHDIYKQKTSPIWNLLSACDSTFPHSPARVHFSGWCLAWEDANILRKGKQQSD